MDARDEYENTPLHKAAYCGYVNAVKALLENGANVRAEDKYEKTPLMEQLKRDMLGL